MADNEQTNADELNEAPTPSQSNSNEEQEHLSRTKRHLIDSPTTAKIYDTNGNRPESF